MNINKKTKLIKKLKQNNAWIYREKARTIKEILKILK